MADQRQVYVPKNTLDSYVSVLYAEKLELGNREPSFNVGIKANQKNSAWSAATATVVHHLRGEDKFKTYDIETKPQYIRAALEELIRFASIPYSDEKIVNTVWSIRGKKIAGGKITNEIIEKGKLVVGRDRKGPFITVVSWNTKFPRIKFYPGLHDPNSVAPTSMDDPEQLYNYVCASAVGWAKHTGEVFSAEWQRIQNEINDRVRREQAQNGGGYNGGGYSGGGSEGSSYSTTVSKSYSSPTSSSADDEDDGMLF